ncbi:MAG: prolipoprotein diacylglyceryl transferase [Chloroflexi bacterium]|nr:prolipoprotein diacylglyceryl transferase [Chloroflexota bacterium]
MIRIGMDPNIVQFGTFVMSWHGVLSLVAVVVAVWLTARWGRREGIDPEAVYAVAVWAIIGGIVGARLLHVIDNWQDTYSKNLALVFAVWNGGIAIYGAILGGFVTGAGYIWGRQLLGRAYRGETLAWLRGLVGERIARGYLKGRMYALFQKFSIGRLADVTAPALLIAQTIGRIGDVINGEHFAKTTGLPWGFIYTHETTKRLYESNGLSSLIPTHPAVVYEMLWNMVVLAVIWKLRGRLAPPGMLFSLYLMLYSLGRFFVQFLRMDIPWFRGLTEAHLVALVVMAITVPLLAYRAKWVRQPAATGTPPGPQRRPRAQR